jgi:hypothetical protein
MIDQGRTYFLYAFVPIFREQEKSFWQRIADTLYSQYSSHLVISGPAVNRVHSFGRHLTAIPLNHRWKSSSQPCGFNLIDTFQSVINNVEHQASLWQEVYSGDDQLIHASSIALHLSAINPIAVLVWNWHRPEGLLARTIAQSMGIQCWDIERTPWPGMLTLDNRGQLSETNLSDSLRILSEKHVELKSPLKNDLQLYLDRANEYISIIRSSSFTWWRQPDSGVSNAKAVRHHENYINAKYRILFAGQVDNDVQNFLFNPLYENNIDAFGAVLNSLPEGSFVVGKHHPMSRTPVSAYQQLIDRTPHVTGVWSQDLDVESSLSLVDYVVAVNSSFLFEAICQGKSCFELGTTMLSGLNIFYDSTNREDLKDAIIQWLSSPLNDSKKREIRFRVMTGFALSHGLLSFEVFAFTFREPDCDVFMLKWLNQVIDIQVQQESDMRSEKFDLHSPIPSNTMAIEGLISYASTLDSLTRQLSLKSATSVKKSAIALLESIKHSITRRTRR